MQTKARHEMAPDLADVKSILTILPIIDEREIMRTTMEEGERENSAAHQSIDSQPLISSFHLYKIGAGRFCGLLRGGHFRR